MRIDTKPLQSTSNPRVLVLSNLKGRWSAAHQPGEVRATMNGVESWVYAFNGDYCGYKEATTAEIANYDIVIANSNLSFLPDFIRLAESRPQHTHWVMLIEGDASDYIALHPTIQRAFAVSDVVNCINRFTVPLLRELVRLSGACTKVEYIGIPYPIEGVRQFATLSENRFTTVRKSVLLCSPLLSRSNDYAVARMFQQAHSEITYYGFEKRISRKWVNWREFWRERSLDPTIRLKRTAQFYNDPHLVIRPFDNLHTFFARTADTFLWLNLDPRFTWGRYVLDAAALGIPIITTASTGHGELLFPDTTLQHEYDLDGAVLIAERLLTDALFYQHITEYAFEALQAYSASALTARLCAFLEI
jgi:hypothetical protein